MSALYINGELVAGLEVPASGGFWLTADTTASSTKPVPTIKWFDGTTYAFPSSASAPITLTGGVVAINLDGVTIDAAGSGSSLEVKNGGVSLAKLANLTGPTWIGLNTGTGTPIALTPTQSTAMLNLVTASLQGLMSPAQFTALASALTGFSVTAPIQNTGTTGSPVVALNYDGVTLDASGAGSSLEIKNGGVSLAKLANVAGPGFIGLNAAGPATPIVMTATQATAILNLATGSVQGLMSSSQFAQLAAYPSAPSGLTITESQVTNLTTDLSNKQPLDADLTSIAASPYSSGSVAVGTGASAVAQVVLGADTFLARSSSGAVAAKATSDYAIATVMAVTNAAGLTALVNPATVSLPGAMTAAQFTQLAAYPSAPSGLTLTESQVTNLTTDLAAKQPLDADLTAIAASPFSANSVPVGTGASTLSQIVLAANTFLARASSGAAAAKSITDYAINTIAAAANAAGLTALIGLATTALSGAMSTADKRRMRSFIDPMADYGVVADCRVSFDGACNVSTSTTTINSAGGNNAPGAAFTSSDVGKRVCLAGAGASGAMYVGTVQAVLSSTSIQVTPALSTTVSSRGLRTHTDDLAAWTSLITDLNAGYFPGAVIMTESLSPVSGAPVGYTGRSGISGILPTISKQARFSMTGGGHTADAGDYTRIGGFCFDYAATTAPASFAAVMTFAPTLGVTAQNLKHVVLEHFWIDCRNLDQPGAAGLKGLSLQSCFGFEIHDVFVQDPGAVGMEHTVVAPGTAVPNAGSLGEAKDCSRGLVTNFNCRALDSPSGSQTTPVNTTTTTLTLTTTGQSLALGANSLLASGYAWVQTAVGYRVPMFYGGGGGTTTLTGCVVSAIDAINVPVILAGASVVQAVPGNACCILLNGDLTANACLTTWKNITLSHGTTFGPAAWEFFNADSHSTENVVINGGNNTTSGSFLNRFVKNGISLHGSVTNATLTARNNTFLTGSAGVGGLYNVGWNSGTAVLTYQAGPTKFLDYQLGNGEPQPIQEGDSALYVEYNGGFFRGGQGKHLYANQTAIVNVASLVTGSTLAIPPQGFGGSLNPNAGTVLVLEMIGLTTTTATATTFALRLGTTKTTSDTIIAQAAPTSVATTAASFILRLKLSVRTLGSGGSCLSHWTFTHAAATGGVGGAANVVPFPGTNPNAMNTTLQNAFLTLWITTGAAASSVTPQSVGWVVEHPMDGQ